MIPLPPLSDLVVIQAVFSIALVSKVLSPRDLGQYNLGSRPGAPGCIRELVFVDCNGWEEYEEHQHAAFPNMRKASGFWKTVAHYDAGLKQNPVLTHPDVPSRSGSLDSEPQGLCTQAG